MQSGTSHGYLDRPLGLGSQQNSYNIGGPSQYADSDLNSRLNRHNTISHEHNPNMTQFSSGFPKNPLSRRANGPGGFLNQTADHAARNMGSTSYSKKDVEEARDGLKLLKSRMGAGAEARRCLNTGTAHSASRPEAIPNQSHANSDKGPASRKTQYGGP